MANNDGIVIVEMNARFLRMFSMDKSENSKAENLSRVVRSNKLFGVVNSLKRKRKGKLETSRNRKRGIHRGVSARISALLIFSNGMANVNLLTLATVSAFHPAVFLLNVYFFKLLPGTSSFACIAIFPFRRINPV